MSKVLDNIWETIKETADTVYQFFTHESLVFLKALASAIRAGGGPLLVEAARAAVRAAQEQGGSASDKKAAAFASVEASLKSQGIPLIVTAINGALEAAYAEMKVQLVGDVSNPLADPPASLTSAADASTAANQAASSGDTGAAV